MAFCARVVAALLVLSSVAGAQTLARKGWAGSGMTVEPWWQSAVFYQLDPVSFQDSDGDGFGDLRGITDRLPYLQALGVDALVLSPFVLQAPGAAQPFDRTYGTEDDFDQLEREAGLRKVRIIVDLPVRATGGTELMDGVARFWLSRGVAGLRITREPGSPELSTAQRADRVRDLRRICAGYAGQRVLIWDAGETGPAVAAASRSARGEPARTEMVVDRRLETLTAAELRAGLGGVAAGAVVATDSDGSARSLDRLGDGTHDLALARQLATVLLAGRGIPLLYFGQEIGMATTPEHATTGGDPTPMQWGAAGFTTGVPWIDMGRNAATANVAVEDEDPDSLLNWYRKLVMLHHGNAALRSGTLEVLAGGDPDVLVWVRKARGAEGTAPPVLVALNLSGRAVVVSVASLSASLQHAGVSGGTLKVLAKTSSDADAGLANAIALEPNGAYVGELVRHAGLETVVLPARARRR